MILDEGLKQLNRCLLGSVTNEKVSVKNISKKIKMQWLHSEESRCYNRRTEGEKKKGKKVERDAGLYLDSELSGR